MGNLCSTPSVRDPIGRHDRLGYGHGPMGMARPGEHPNMVNPAYGYYGVAARPTALQVPPDAMLRGPGPAQQQVSTPTTTTSTTTTTKEAENLQQAEVALPSRAPIHEGVGQEVLDDEEPYHHDQQTQFNWTKGKLIGAGAFGRVFQGLDNDSGQIMAVKQVALTKDEALKGRVAEHIKALEAEVAVLRQLNHRNIVRYLGTERSDDTLNIFLEYVPGGSIASLIDKFGPLQESVVRKYTQQILRGLEYLHQKKIMHRDIKGANILVDGTGTVKLADFGASKKIEDLATMASGSKSIRGTPFWMAPEVIKQTGHGRPADIWSLGCVVIEMATGKPPWSNCNTQVAAMFHIASTKEPPQLPEFLSAEAKDFLLLCFNRVPKERPNATRLLRHPWMANIPPNPNSASTASMAAAGNGSTGATGNGPRATQRSHPLVPMLPLQNALSPPSPIKEEPETARSQAAAAAATAAQPPVSAQRAQLPPPVPMAIGPLEHGRRQSLMPQTAASLAMSSGLPPLPPNASQRASAAVAAPSVAPPVPAAAPAPEPAAAPASAAQPPRVMTLLGQAPAEQYDTIVSPSSIPAALLAANAAAAAAAAPVPAPAAPQCNPSQELLAHATSSGAQSDSSSHSNLAELGRTSVLGVRSSMLTLNYNPMEEPSWMPAMHNQQVLPQLSRALSSIREPVDAAPSPRNAPTPRDQQQHAAPVEVVLAATTSGDSAQDTTGEADQPEGQRIVRATSAEAARKASSSAQLPAPSVTASVAGIPHASSLSKRQLAAGEADPVRQSKLQKWRDELSAELSKKRQELRTQAATGGSNGQYGLPDAALPLVSEVGEA